MRHLLLSSCFLFFSLSSIAQWSCSNNPDTLFTCLEEEFILSSGIQSGTFFDGEDDFILMENPAVIGAQSFSISFDALTGHNGRMDIVSQSCGTDCWADIRCGFNTPQCGLEGISFKSPAHFATWPFEVSDEEWHTYTYVFGENSNFSYSNIQVYVDGVNVMDIESTQTFCGHNWGGWTYNPESDPIRIGKGDPLGGFFSGYLRNIAIWSSALDSAYVADHHQAININDSNLISMWPLNALEDGYFLDLKGDNHGLPMGGIETLEALPEGEVDWFNESSMPNQYLFANTSDYYNYSITLADGQTCEDSIWVEVEPSPYVDLNNNGICDHLDGSGCLDPSACNYDPFQTDSISCIFPVYGNDCDAGAFICATGTSWDAHSQSCLPLPTPPDYTCCGEGTIWDAVTQSCLPEMICQEDLDHDGVIGINDLMDMLSAFGSFCED
jgi:hypothetical protein